MKTYGTKQHSNIALAPKLWSTTSGIFDAGFAESCSSENSATHRVRAFSDDRGEPMSLKTKKRNQENIFGTKNCRPRHVSPTAASKLCAKSFAKAKETLKEMVVAGHEEDILFLKNCLDQYLAGRLSTLGVTVSTPAEWQPPRRKRFIEWITKLGFGKTSMTNYRYNDAPEDLENALNAALVAMPMDSMILSSSSLDRYHEHNLLGFHKPLHGDLLTLVLRKGAEEARAANALIAADSHTHYRNPRFSIDAEDASNASTPSVHSAYNSLPNSCRTRSNPSPLGEPLLLAMQEKMNLHSVLKEEPSPSLLMAAIDELGEQMAPDQPAVDDPQDSETSTVLDESIGDSRDSHDKDVFAPLPIITSIESTVLPSEQFVVGEKNIGSPIALRFSGATELSLSRSSSDTNYLAQRRSSGERHRLRRYQTEPMHLLGDAGEMTPGAVMATTESLVSFAATGHHYATPQTRLDCCDWLRSKAANRISLQQLTQKVEQLPNKPVEEMPDCSQDLRLSAHGGSGKGFQSVNPNTSPAKLCALNRAQSTPIFSSSRFGYLQHDSSVDTHSTFRTAPAIPNIAFLGDQYICSPDQSLNAMRRRPNSFPIREFPITPTTTEQTPKLSAAKSAASRGSEHNVCMVRTSEEQKKRRLWAKSRRRSMVYTQPGHKSPSRRCAQTLVFQDHGSSDAGDDELYPLLLAHKLGDNNDCPYNASSPVTVCAVQFTNSHLGLITDASALDVPLGSAWKWVQCSTTAILLFANQESFCIAEQLLPELWRRCLSCVQQVSDDPTGMQCSILYTSQYTVLTNCFHLQYVFSFLPNRDWITIQQVCKRWNLSIASLRLRQISVDLWQAHASNDQANQRLTDHADQLYWLESSAGNNMTINAEHKLLNRYNFSWLEDLLNSGQCQLLGEGACKRVHMISDVQYRKYAVSVLDLMDLAEREMQQSVSTELFLTLMCSELYQLNICPSLLAVFGSFQTETLPAQLVSVGDHVNNRFQLIVSELCAAGDLESLLRQRALPTEVQRSLLLQMIFTFYTLREHFQLRHFDVKLLNFLVTDEPSVAYLGFEDMIFCLPSQPYNSLKLIDFGTAVIGERSLLDPVSVQQFTTLENVAPELLLLGSQATQSYACDTFALGLCMVHLLAGKAPYEELMDSVNCPMYLMRKLEVAWRATSGQYVVLREVLRSLDEDEDDLLRCLCDTLYRYVVLLGLQQMEASLYSGSKVASLLRQVLRGDASDGRVSRELQICRAEYQKHHQQWQLLDGDHATMRRVNASAAALGPGASDLLRRLLCLDPAHRISMHAALQHDVFASLRCTGVVDGRAAKHFLHYFHRPYLPHV